jgi:ligand-binding sensor domain-containing protein
MITRAQATNVIFDRITMDSGLSSSSVTSILKDRTGYVWVGTTEGLNRYDGYTFKVFLPVPDCPESIQSSSIDKLFEDSDGGIWIFFSSGGISRYDRGSDTFLNFTKEWLRQQLRVYGSPTCFSASVPGHIFIGTENGMLEYDAKEKKLVRLSSAGSVVSSSPVNCLYSAPDHSFWVGTLAGFSLYDKETNHFQDYTIRTNDREDINAGNLNGVNAIYIDRFDYMWLGTGREGAFRSVDMGEREIFQSVGREDTRVYQFLETGDGDFWIGHNKGTSLISRMNRLALRCEHFFDRPEDLEPTGECQVRSIFESKDGTVWFDDSRFNQGLFYYSPKERKMGQLRNVPEDAHSISSNQITCLFLDDSDHLWAGHSTYGVSHADLTPSLFRYTLGYTEKENLSSLHILAVYEDSDLNLWVATSRGLDRINHKTSRVDMRFTFSPRKSPSSLSGKIIGSIREDSERNLWISYQDANPDRLNLDDFRIRPFIPDYQVSYDYPINSLSELCNLCVSEESWFWGGADEGRLRVWDTKTRALITYRYIPDEMNPLASNHIHCLFVDSSGYLWIGTNAGLDQYDKRTGRFDHFTVQDGLSGNIVRGIREGEPGILFVSTNKGLSRLDIQNRHIVNYTTANGLLSNEFMGGACCKRKSGELVFGSNEGIVSFDPVQLTDGLRKIPESLRITNLTIGDSREKQGLQVGFIAFDYSHPRSIRYRYRLDGYDTDWREVDASDRTAIYNRLPPGNYVFRVETSGNGSYWSAPITEPVRIFPPWWRTWWFILLVFVVVCVLLCIAYKSRVRWYQLRQAELECKIQERTRLLKQAKQELEEKDALKTRFFMNVSHELRTPLTIIKGLTEDLERHSGSEVSCGDKGILRTISRNTNRLIWHVNELLDLSVLTRGVPSPHIVCADLSRFLEDISETFIPLADSYKIAFTYSIAPDISIAYFDKNILEQVLYNLLSNAFKRGSIINTS